MGQQKSSGYNRRALIEADVARFKRVVGDALHSHTDGRQRPRRRSPSACWSWDARSTPEYVRIA
jgi:hypothetical protein